MYYHFYNIFTGLNVIHLLLITLVCVNRLNIIFIEILYFVFIFIHLSEINTVNMSIKIKKNMK